MKKHQIKAFTLVELIIVITILAILATIGFISYQSYTLDARDGKRVSDLGQIRKGLEIYQTKNSVLPSPDAQITNIVNASSVLEYQGYAGNNVLNKIRADKVQDPKDNIQYTYSTNGDYTKFQLMSMLENGSAVNISQTPVNTTYAANDYTSRKTYVVGNKLGVFLDNSTKAPIQETLSGNIDLAGAYSGTNFKVVFSNTSVNSGTIVGSGVSLYNNVLSIANTVASQINSCATQPDYIGATFTIGSPTIINQVWQGTDSTKGCYYTCGVGKVLVGNACVSESCTGTTPDGTAAISNATSFAGGTWNYNTTPGLCTYYCGTGYNYIGTSCIKIGSTSTNPGLSCLDILNKGGNVGDGTYRIKPTGVATSFQVYCDMTTDGGGWTLAGYAGDNSSGFPDMSQIIGTYSPNSRTGKASISGAVNLAKISTEFAIGFSTNTNQTGNIKSYYDVVSMKIPDPSIVTLSPSDTLSTDCTIIQTKRLMPVGSSAKCVGTRLGNGISSTNCGDSTATPALFKKSLGAGWSSFGYGLEGKERNCINFPNVHHKVFVNTSSYNWAPSSNYLFNAPINGAASMWFR